MIPVDVLVFGELQALLGHRPTLRLEVDEGEMTAGKLWLLIGEHATRGVSPSQAAGVAQLLKVAALAVNEEVVDKATEMVNLTNSTVAVLPPLSGG